MENHEQLNVFEADRLLRIQQVCEEYRVDNDVKKLRSRLIRIGLEMEEWDKLMKILGLEP